MLKFYNDAKLKAGVFFREWKEKRAEQKETEPAGVTIPLSLVRSAKLAAWMAYFSLVYFLWLYTLDIARDRAASLHLTHVGSWIGEVQFYFPYIVGFAIVAIGIPYVAKIAIPTFMSLSWRGNFWPKLWALFIAVAVSLVVIAGTFTVQGDTILERDRDSAVAVEQVQIAAATLAAQIGDVQHAMDERTQSPSAYVRTAASMSPEAYDRFVAARQGDPQYQRLLSYRAVSEEMVALNQRMSTLRAQQAQSTAVASVQGVVTTERTSWIANTLGWLEGARAMLLSFVMDIVCLIMPWIALRLEQARNRQVGMADGIALHPYMLPDRRAEENHGEFVNPQKRSAQDVVDAMIAGGADPRFAADMARSAARSGVTTEEMYDAETGEKLTYRKGTWVRPPKRNGKGREGTFQAEAGNGAIERGADKDGGNRSGVTLGGVMELPESAARHQENPEPQSGEEQNNPVYHVETSHSEDGERKISDNANSDDSSLGITQPDLQSDDEAALALQEELMATDDAPEGSENGREEQAEDQAEDETSSVEHHETSEREEPETNPSRMIAAE